MLVKWNTQNVKNMLWYSTASMNCLPVNYSEQILRRGPNSITENERNGFTFNREDVPAVHFPWRSIFYGSPIMYDTGTADESH